jgi:hypothetical protein
MFQQTFVIFRGFMQTSTRTTHPFTCLKYHKLEIQNIYNKMHSLYNMKFALPLSSMVERFQNLFSWRRNCSFFRNNGSGSHNNNNNLLPQKTSILRNSTVRISNSEYTRLLQANKWWQAYCRYLISPSVA